MDFSSITKTVRELALFEKLNLAEFITDENIEYDLYEHDNWNGGIDYYRVILNIPIEYYSALKKTNSITELEKNICELFKDSMRSMESVKITEVVAQPNASKTIFTNGFIDDSRWRNGYYRLFISHLTLYKTSASHLKQCLLKYGIDSFVAHEDIEPTKEWEIEIEKALFTMDALCAIIVPKFNESKWCDQEIGIALGLQRPILLIKKGMDPYGFVGKYQALNNCDDAYKMAQKVWEAILSNNKTSVIL